MTISHFDASQQTLFLRMQSDWELIDDIRRFVESFCAAACPGSDREAQVALAAHELVQNAISNATEPGVELALEVDAAQARVSIAVSNHCADEQLLELRERIRLAKADPDPLAAYLAAMHAAPRSRGGLGLARIRYESELELTVEQRGDRVTVIAAGPLRPGTDAVAPRMLSQRAP
jgi:anti-sigma regulatory factor (Ser/Thr protein kinase)